MDGVFMKKCMRRLLTCALAAAVFWSIGLIADRSKLNQGLIRFHVVANSDSAQDQAVKRSVRDAVLNSLHTELHRITDMDAAREYLQDSLPKIRLLVEKTLKDLGYPEDCRVSLCKERFDIRHYDTFSLPAGVYDSLRIVIGDGLGKNWWCVSFPTLCVPQTVSGFTDAAVGAGFSEPLVQTLAGNEAYEIRFYCLDLLGRVENIFFQE